MIVITQLEEIMMDKYVRPRWRKPRIIRKAIREPIGHRITENDIWVFEGVLIENQSSFPLQVRIENDLIIINKTFHATPSY